jgi:hypothetical protein
MAKSQMEAMVKALELLADLEPPVPEQGAAGAAEPPPPQSVKVSCSRKVSQTRLSP